MSGKFALIIANTEYTDPGLAQLTAPGKDAKELGRVLDSSDIGAFDDVIILFNENESKVSEAIDYFFALKKPDDLLVLYFSGHGVRDEYGSLYLAVKNTNRARLRSTAVKSDFIRDAMDQSRSRRQVLILDCCNSGAFAQGTKAEAGGSMGTASAFEGKGYGRVVLTASDATQFAWEGDKVIGGDTANSLFTHFLVKGLEGEADRDGDGKITVDELYDYVYEQIVNITPKQTPGKWSYKQQGEILLRQNIRVEDTRPVPLSDELVAAMNNSLPYIREGAVSQLELLLKGKNLSLARSARLALERIVAEDDSRRVVQTAAKALESNRPAGQQEALKAEAGQPASSTRTAQLRREKTELEARLKTREETLLKEKDELAERLKEERIAREKADAQRKAQEEAQQFTAQKAETKKPARDRVEAQPAPAKSRLKPFGILAIAIVTIVACGYAIRGFLSLLQFTPTETPLITSAPTEASAATQEPTEGVAPTEAPIVTAELTEDTATMPPVSQLEIPDSKGVAMVLVQAGNFSMGNNKGDTDERPGHDVYLDAYYIDKFEVTNALYKACVNAGACKSPIQSDSLTYSSYYGNSQYDDYPVVYVNWNMANAYCTWRGARLPTEAQWEKAARGSDARTYPWGNGLDCQKANYQGCGVVGTSRVGNYKGGISPYGAYDMAGNVWEWVADRYSETYYKGSPSSNPLGPDLGQSRVLRGGSWNRGQNDITAFNRLKYAPDYNTFDFGFRCAK